MIIGVERGLYLIITQSIRCVKFPFLDIKEKSGKRRCIPGYTIIRLILVRRTIWGTSLGYAGISARVRKYVGISSKDTRVLVLGYEGISAGVRDY